MEIPDPKIMTIEILSSGIVKLILEMADGQTKSFLEEDLKDDDKSLPAALERKQFDWFKMFGVCSFSGSDLKVYLNVGDRVYCFLIDSVTGKFNGTC